MIDPPSSSRIRIIAGVAQGPKTPWYMTLAGVYDPRRIRDDQALVGSHLAMLEPTNSGASLALPTAWRDGLCARLVPDADRKVALLPEQLGIVTLLSEDPVDQASESWWRYAKGGDDYRFPFEAYESYRQGVLESTRRDGVWRSLEPESLTAHLDASDVDRLGFTPPQEVYLTGRWSFATCEGSRARLDLLDPLRKQDIVEVLGETGDRYSDGDHPHDILLPSEQRWVESATTALRRGMDASGAGDREEQILALVTAIHDGMRRSPGRRAAFLTIGAVWAVLLSLVASAIWEEYSDVLLRLLHLLAAH